MTKIEQNMKGLADFCKEFGCTEREAMEEILITFYETAGFWADLVEEEIASMNDEELLNAFLNL